MRSGTESSPRDVLVPDSTAKLSSHRDEKSGEHGSLRPEVTTPATLAHSTTPPHFTSLTIPRTSSLTTIAQHLSAPHKQDCCAHVSTSEQHANLNTSFVPSALHPQHLHSAPTPRTALDFAPQFVTWLWSSPPLMQVGLPYIRGCRACRALDVLHECRSQASSLGNFTAYYSWAKPRFVGSMQADSEGAGTVLDRYLK